MTADEWIKHLNLEQHPEGGFFKEVYRSNEQIAAKALPERFEGNRNFSTSIYFLLTSSSFSAFHRIQQDELWHFYDGDPLVIHQISPEGQYTSQKLGRNPSQNQHLQIMVPQGHWFGAALETENLDSHYSLVGCTVAPGFDFADFDMPDQQTLRNQFPQHEDIINRLTHD